MNSDVLLDLLQLGHHVLIYVQTTCGIEDHHVVTVLFRIFDRFLCDLHRLYVRAHVEHVDANLITIHVQLLNGCGTIDVAGNQQALLTLLSEFTSQLRGSSRFTCTLKACHHDHRNGLTGLELYLRGL